MPPMQSCDFLVIGAGIAGTSAAAELAAHGRVVLVERESQPGYHSTGRSAASFNAVHEDPLVTALIVGSRPFLEAPPAAFWERPLLGPRGVLIVAPSAQRAALDALAAQTAASGLATERLDVTAAQRLVPVLDPSVIGGALLDPSAMDLDVDALLQGWLGLLRHRGGTLLTGAEVRTLQRGGGRWRVETTAGAFEAPVVVNAAGAWADEIATLGGVRPLGLVPKRRSAFIFHFAGAHQVANWPMVKALDETFYFKPDAGRLLGSPCDQTPVPPCDARPHELDVATAVARIEAVTTARVSRVERRWAGLRSFVGDGRPVVGLAADAEGFCWLAGQGGIGIETAPALARATSSLLTAGSLPVELQARGLRAQDLAPDRLR